MQQDESAMRDELSKTYAKLETLQLDLHARDFWRMRASKQATQVKENALLHEHTAILQYVDWHAADGSRLPAFLRGGQRAIAGNNPV